MNVALGLKVLGVVVVGGAQVHAVVHLGRLERLAPLTRRLVEDVEQVVALAVLEQPLSVLLQNT